MRCVPRGWGLGWNGTLISCVLLGAIGISFCFEWDPRTCLLTYQPRTTKPNCLGSPRSNYFARDSVALPGLAAHFRKESNEERAHAEQVMEYQTERGGKVILGPLAAPPSEFGEGNNKDALNAAELALSMEKLNLTKLLQLHVVADKAGDCQTCDYVEGDLLQPQRASVDEAARMVRTLHRIGDNGHDVWDFDRSLA